MKTQDFTTTLLLDQSPAQVFSAINNVRGWWSEEIEGGTERLNDEFAYHYKDIHRCRMKLTEVVPGKKVVWDVLDNYFDFIHDQSEWKGTRVVFDISEKNGRTELVFTHHGLVPAYECYGVCRDAWTNYIQNSLRNLIETGKGQPNPKEDAQVATGAYDYQTSMTVKATPHHVFDCINNVSQWWTEDMEGSSQELNDEFTVRFADVHMSVQKIIELVPYEKVVWLVTGSRLNFLQDKQEWTNTRISFELSGLNDEFTHIQFRHLGLVPALECFEACSNVWTQYIQESLLGLISTGKGQPGKKEHVANSGS